MILLLSPAFGQETCFPVSNALNRMVGHSVVGDEAAVFVEEPSRCDQGLPAVEPPRVPAGLHGRPAIEWLLDALSVDGRRTHELWSRGDAWLVAPRTGAVALDTVVAVDASRSPDVQSAMMSLNPQVADVLGAVLPMAGCAHYFTDGVERRVSDDVRGPLLEVLRALHRPHENPDAKIGWVVLPGTSLWPMADTSGAINRATPPMHSIVEVQGDVHAMRAPNGDIFAVLGWDNIPATWVEADEVIQVNEDGMRYIVESALLRPPTPPPPPSVWPPPYPFPLGR